MLNISKWKGMGSRIDALEKQGVIGIYPERIHLTGKLFASVSAGKTLKTKTCDDYIRISFYEDGVEIFTLMEITTNRVSILPQETLLEAKKLAQELEEEGRNGFIYASGKKIQIEKDVMFASFFPEKKEDEAMVQDGDFTIFAVI